MKVTTEDVKKRKKEILEETLQEQQEGRFRARRGVINKLADGTPSQTARAMAQAREHDIEVEVSGEKASKAANWVLTSDSHDISEIEFAKETFEKLGESQKAKDAERQLIRAKAAHDLERFIKQYE